MNAVASVISNAIVRNESLSIAEIADVSLASFKLMMNPRWLRKAQHPRRSRGSRSGLDERINISFGSGNPNDRPRLSQSFRVAKPDTVGDGIYRALKKSAEEQFSGTIPALLAANLLDLTSGQLKELASGPSVLAEIASRPFLGVDAAQHLFGVAFVSLADAPTKDVYGTALSGHGTALFFRRADTHCPKTHGLTFSSVPIKSINRS